MRRLLAMTPDESMSASEASSLVIEHMRAGVRELSAGEARRQAVQISGGIDSALLAASLVAEGMKPTCYVVGDGPENADICGAREVCGALDLPLVEIIWDPEDVAHEVGEMAAIKRSRSVFDIAYGLLEQAVIDRLDADGVDRFWTGNGADILLAGGREPREFGDPWRMAEWERSVWESMLPVWFWRSCFAPGWKRDHREREPFRGLEMASAVRQIPPRLWWGDGADKLPLRLAAVRLGVPASVAFQQKAAAQMSSGVYGVIARDMLERVDDETDLRVTSPPVEAADLLLAVRIWVAWHADRAGVAPRRDAQPRAIPSFSQMLEMLDVIA